MFIYFLKIVIFFHIIFLQIFLVLLRQSLIQKKLHSLNIFAESFWVVLGLILVVFLCLLRAVKPFLIKFCKDIFCTNPVLTALKKLREGEGTHFHYYFLFFEKGSVSFHFLKIFLVLL